MTDELGFRFTWSGHSAVELETPGGKHVLFDPWFSNPRSKRKADDVESCDVLLVSHGHFDHLGGDVGSLEKAEAIQIAKRLKPTWMAVHELSVWLAHVMGDVGANVVGMNVGGTVEIGGLKVTMVPAVHSSGDWSNSADTALSLGVPVGFVVQLEDGQSVYFAGDTDVFGDMSLIRELHKPHVAFLPIGGHYTMGPRGAAKAAALLGVDAVIPLHYGTFPILAGTPDELRTELRSMGHDKVTVVSPEPGETVR